MTFPYELDVCAGQYEDACLDAIRASLSVVGNVREDRIKNVHFKDGKH